MLDRLLRVPAELQLEGLRGEDLAHRGRRGGDEGHHPRLGDVRGVPVFGQGVDQEVGRRAEFLPHRHLASRHAPAGRLAEGRLQFVGCGGLHVGLVRRNHHHWFAALGEPRDFHRRADMQHGKELADEPEDGRREARRHLGQGGRRPRVEGGAPTAAHARKKDVQAFVAREDCGLRSKIGAAHRKVVSTCARSQRGAPTSRPDDRRIHVDFFL
mmetsp:Transcript_22816/g.46487  ORF Transcript_22816/g.46487 Transcript_22816/m.46487 type:complete len:213 (+) Transcript_22816:1899-2537(+)